VLVARRVRLACAERTFRWSAAGQVRVLHELQPYQSGNANRDYIGHTVTHLAESLEAAELGNEVVGVWATNYEPEFHPPAGSKVESFDVQQSGLLQSRKLLARFHVTPPDTVGEVQVRPNVALDPVFSAPPWPIKLEDNADARSSGLLVIARRLIEGLERSVSTPTFIQQFGRLDDVGPIVATSVWLPVQFADKKQETEARTGLAQSDLNLASYRADDGTTYTLMRIEGDTVVGREIPEASPPGPSADVGLGVELATLDAAAALGLPDFVFRPKVVRKGSGLREFGDGTIVTGVAAASRCRSKLAKVRPTTRNVRPTG